MRKLSMRIRVTILNVLLLTVCCVGLTFTLNLSANKMANNIEATLIMPPMEASEDRLSLPITPMTPSKSSKLARTDFLYRSLLYMLTIVVSGGVMTYYLAGKALKPLSKLSGQMRNVTVHNLSENLLVPESNDEIAELTRSFNHMSNKLDNAFAMQKRFSQSAAHELRTPLTVLRTKIDVFRKKEDRTHEEYIKLIDVFSANTNRLSDLVKDLLSLTNILEVDLDDEIALTKVFEEIIKEVTPLLSDKNITLSLYNNTNKIILNGNKNLLYRAFYNIVENAIKYNFDNGSVEISLDVQEGKNIVSIKDSGMSIPNEVKNLIFEPFFRVDKSRNRKIAGSGLGLSTACTIIEKHKGEIVVLDNPSGGSIFKITL